MGGATEKIVSPGPNKKFQSTRPWGARQDEYAAICFSFGFQSTRPWGARPDMIVSPGPNKKFQSTRPWGARQMTMK